MPTNIFISHAGADWERVEEISRQLRDHQLQVRLDREELKQGDSFLSFMESALSSCDYCLLLWSAAAARSKWVRVEWEAAFHRTIEHSQRFLVIGRLEDHPIPELLRPRLRVDLFPEVATGINSLVEMWRHDQAASIESARPVLNPSIAIQDDPAGTAVYISSKSWDKTFPLRVNMHLPVALILDQITSMLGLPHQLDYAGKMGVRFHYELVHQDKTLKQDLSPDSQGIEANYFLWLQTTMELFGSTQPVQGSFGSVTLRGNEELDLKIAAEHHLQSHLAQVGLGYRKTT